MRITVVMVNVRGDTPRPRNSPVLRSMLCVANARHAAVSMPSAVNCSPRYLKRATSLRGAPSSKIVRVREG